MPKNKKNPEQDGFKIQLTSFEKGIREETIIIPRLDQKELEAKLKEVSQSLGENKKMNLFLLTTLITRQLDE